MAVAKRFNENGEGKSEQQLPGTLFEAPVHEQALYETVKVYLKNQRQGTAKTKERSEVSYSTAKLFRQKGTGRARAGSLKSPLRPGGGTIFGPKPRDHKTRLNRKVKRLALLSALSDRAANAAISVVEDPSLDAPKTRIMASMLANMGLGEKKVLFVVPDDSSVLFKSLRNIQGVDVLPAYQINAYRVLRSDELVFTEASLQQVTEVFGA